MKINQLYDFGNIRISWFLILFFFSPTSLADCQKLISNLVKKLQLQVKLETIELSACKIWPHSPDKTIVVVTRPSDSPKYNEGVVIYDMDLLIVDNRSEKIIAHRFEREAYSNDAVFADGIGIDTAPYQLNSSIRAFGVYFHLRNTAHYNNYSGSALNLYYLQEKELRMALRGLSMSDSFSEWNDNCKGDFKDFNRVIVIDKEQNNGFNNLIINTIITSSKLRATKNENCEKTITNTKKRTIVFKYNGNDYFIPERYKAEVFLE
jgi:hypothetical protein